mgnify:CR=1 FL=1
MNREEIDEIAEGAIVMDGFDDCIVGVSEEFGRGTRIVYSKQRIIQKMVKTDLMTEEEADEYFYFNMVGGHFGERNPIFLTTFMAV